MKRFENTELSLTEAAAAFAALGSEQRLGILQVLVRAGPEGLSMGELGERSGVRGSTLTHHLRILTAAGLVEPDAIWKRDLWAVLYARKP